MAFLATALACLAMHPGCSGPPIHTPKASPFLIVYERDGGLKPMPRKLKVTPNRIGITEELRPGIGESDGAGTIFKVPLRTIQGLRRALGRVGFSSIPDPGTDPGTCADCYLYAIRYRDHEVRFDDVTMPPSLGPVLDRLEAIFEAHRPFH